jgi:hypothetical protein
MMFQMLRAFLVLVFCVVTLEGVSHAGVFGMSHFVVPGNFAVGIEPELTLATQAGLAANVKWTQGISDLNNVTAIIGTGAEPRKFRVGGNMTFDFFPDIENQPGIGIGTQAIYYRIGENGRLEVHAVPYVHKAFQSSGGEFEPYVAIPFGVGFSDGQYKAISNVAVGSMFKNSEKFRYVLELGVAINNSDSYVSGGVIYYH